MKTSNEPAKPGKTKSATRSGGGSPRSLGVVESGAGDDCPREQMIAEAAYFRAERRGFSPGNEMSDWLEAEADVEALLTVRH